jgi:hypothetical protein
MKRNTTTTMAMPHHLMKMDKQRMAKMSFQLATSELYGDICTAECLVNA